MGKQNAGAAYAGLSQHVDFSALPSPGDRFTFEKLIGEGTYGAVHSAKDKQQNNHPVAIKILEDIADNIEEIEEEFLVLRDLCSHPNIPQFHGIFFKPGRRRDDDQLWFVMELCTGGSVTDLVQTLTRLGQTLTELQIAYVIKETVDALIYLHKNHCMHRDVKGHNILFSASGRVKLVDFGVSSHLAATMGRRNTSVGTPYWMAPEVIACEQQYDYNYDVRCDVWSLGITAIELADGQPPLADIHPMRALFQIPRNPPPMLRRPADWSPVFNDFIRLCLIKDFEKRPFLRHLLEHPFLKVIPNAAEFVRIQLQDLIADVYQKVSRPSRHIEVTTKRGKLKTDRHSKLTKIYVDDLATLDKLTDDVIIDQLQQRYKSSQIYTYVGDILIAINPFAEVSLYNKEEQGRYRSLAKSDGPPHIYATADTAYHAMIHYKQNQCVVISGESGAGKTESANHLLSQLVNLGQAPNRNLEDKILAMNPIMEAFGNARTGINDNSSRFGKFLDVTFNRIGRVAGARVSVYLLEQSRVVKQDIGQQNFHIFYYLYDSLESENRLQEFHLHPQGKRNQHRYLNFHNQANNKITRKNADKMSVVNRGLSMLGFCRDELASVYRILTSIIHLGDISFMSQNDEQSNTEMVAVKNKDKLKIVCELLGVAQSELEEVLMLNSVVTRGESILRNNSHEEAVTTRDAMAKALYGRLFDWIVNQINQLLSFSRLVNGESLAVGVLDIFGFENLQNNSFEQLCINVANEQLQYYFNQHIFSWEQQEYLAEGIAIDVVEFTDNRPVLDMFLAKPLGMLSLLDEESRFPKATDASLIQKFHNNIGSSSYIRPKGNKLSFEIKHYAGKLEYNCQNMLSKNRNFLPPEVIQVFRQSSLEVVRTLFQCPLTKTGNLFTDSGAPGPHSVPASPRDGVHGSPAEEGPDIGRDLLGKFCSGNRPFALASQTKAQQTVATYFRYSLMDLLQNMVNGTPHFVRCIKPNDSKKPASFDREKVRKQLRYAGVMETVRIRQQGFSHRIAFAEFLRRYRFLAFRFDERLAATAGCCRQLLQRLKMDGWQVGRSKVFLKYYHIEYLSRLYEAKVSKIVKVQAYVRRWLAQVQFRQMKVRRSRSVVTLQRCVRRWLSHKRRREDQPGVTHHGIRGRLSQVEQLVRLENMEHEEATVSCINSSEEATSSKIQRLFLGHPIRKKCSPVLERRIRAALCESSSQIEAHRRLSSIGLSPSESALVLQKCWNNRRVLNSPEQQPVMPLKNKLAAFPQEEQPNKSIKEIGVRSDDSANFQLPKSRDAVTSQQVKLFDQRRPADFNMPHKLVSKSENECQRANKRAASVSPPLPPLKVANQETGEIIRQGVAEMVTIREARLQAIGVGVKCQVKEEAERRESMIGRLTEATRRSGTPDIQVQFPRKVSRPPVLPDAWVAEAQIAACIAEEKGNQEGAVDASDLGGRVPRIQPVSDEGPFNFRQMLRCTDHAPTESLRLRRGWKARPSVDREQDS